MSNYYGPKVEFRIEDGTLYRYTEMPEFGNSNEHYKVVKAEPIMDKETFQKLILDWLVFDEDDTTLALLMKKGEEHLPFERYKLRA